ncbi:MAG TPA: phosphatase PAP2 family protein, partial [Chromatiales bacterium]|nr:phosphatase PAP2 family protein [Chromatiales bacterium]
RLVVLLLVLLVVLWGVVWLVRRLFRLVQPHARSWVQRLFYWGRRHPKSGEIAAALTDPTHPEGGALAVLATLLLLASVAFALILGAVLEGTGIQRVDLWVLDALQSLRTPWADHLMVHISRLTNTAVALSFAIGVLAWFLWMGHWRSAFYWIAATLFALVAPYLLKLLIQIPRPDIGLGDINSDWSFPSGHTLAATVLFGFLAVIVARTMAVQWRWVPYGIAALLTAVVAVSRLYLGVHWLSDVLGSFTLGLAWIAILGLAYNRHTRAESGWRGITATATLFFVFAFASQTWLHHKQELTRYQPIRFSVAMDAEIWWLSDWALLPKVRKDLVGRVDHPLNIQYAGTLRELKLELRSQGWYPAERLGWGNALRLLSPSLPFDHLPVFPQVHDGRHESLILEKRRNGERLVLRLWQSGFRLEAPSAPLWIGNVSRLKRSNLLGVLVFPTTDPEFRPPFETFLPDISGVPHWQPTKERDLILIRGIKFIQ